MTTYLSVHLQHEVKYINVNEYFDSCPINNSISRDLVFYVKNRSLDQNTKLAIDMMHIVFDFNIQVGWILILRPAVMINLKTIRHRKKSYNFK